MLFGKNNVPFPDNPACKRCLVKPCRKLLAGTVYPGKLTFIRTSDFISLPCYTPSWSKSENESKAEPAALTDDLEVIEGVLEISSPAWEHKDEELKESSPESTRQGDTIVISALIKNFPEGAPVSFDIYDISGATPFLIKSVSGKNEAGRACAEWVVEDPQQQGDKLKLAFEAGARSKYTSRTDIPLSEKFKCDFVEMPDVLFNHGSAIPCLDKGGVLAGALSAAFTFAKNNTDREIVLFGHADTSGDPSYNYDLSGWRAEGIKALLDNNSEAFLDVVDLASKVEDYQTILAALAEGHNWSCHPGKVDNIAGEKTKGAIKAFQEEYNNKFKGSLKIDGCIGPKTWTALFTVMHSIVEKIVTTECGEIPSLVYGYNGKGLCPCGESFPVDAAEKDNYKSKENRRVEIVFFEKGKAPVLKEPADKKMVKKKDVPVYDKKVVIRNPILFEVISTHTPFVVQAIFDCHMHIQSGKCIPVPIMRKILKERMGWFSGLLGNDRSEINFRTALSEYGHTQNLDCNEIAADAKKENSETYSSTLASRMFYTQAQPCPFR